MTANEALDNYLSGLPQRVRLAKVRDIYALVGIRKWNLSDWRRGRVRIPLSSQRKISEIVGEDIFKKVTN